MDIKDFIYFKPYDELVDFVIEKLKEDQEKEQDFSKVIADRTSLRDQFINKYS